MADTVNAVGTEDPAGPHMVWFSPYFRNVGFVDAPYCIWQRDGRKITKTPKRGNAPVRVWILTDHYDYRGYRLGVWPD